MQEEVYGKEFWSARWKDKDTRWDIGYPSTPLKEFIDTLTDKSARILIPGCGNAYEAEYLFRKGFPNVFVMDIAEEAIASFKLRVPGFPGDHILHADFFTFNPDQSFDLVLEQTFFCAIPPGRRDEYVSEMKRVIRPGGILAGVLFNDPLLTMENPPFRGDEKEYRRRFSDGFLIEKMEPSRNSIGPREGRELFFIARRK